MAEQTFRCGLHAKVNTWVPVAYAALLTLIALVVHQTGLYVLVGCADVFLAGLAIQSARACVCVDGEKVQVIGLVRSYSIAWIEIDSFGTRKFRGQEAGVVHLRTGRDIQIYALSTGRQANPSRRAEVIGFVHQLNLALQESRGVVPA